MSRHEATSFMLTEPRADAHTQLLVLSTRQRENTPGLHNAPEPGLHPGVCVSLGGAGVLTLHPWAVPSLALHAPLPEGQAEEALRMRCRTTCEGGPWNFPLRVLTHAHSALARPGWRLPAAVTTVQALTLRRPGQRWEGGGDEAGVPPHPHHRSLPPGPVFLVPGGKPPACHLQRWSL